MSTISYQSMVHKIVQSYIDICIYLDALVLDILNIEGHIPRVQVVHLI